jgi:tellurite resistance-related uncharacterized protein
MKEISDDDKNVIDVDFEKQKIQDDLNVFVNSGELPDTLTTRKFLIKYNSIYECITDWSQRLDMIDDTIWSQLIDAYVTYARDIEIAKAADFMKQLEKETKMFLKVMRCKVFKFMTPTIKGDPVYKSHVFSLGRDLEFIAPKIKFNIELTKTEKFKVSLYIAHQHEILDSVNEDLKKINDIICRYKPYNYLTWSEAMYQCLLLRSNLDHLLQSYVSTGEAINASLPYSLK